MFPGWPAVEDSDPRSSDGVFWWLVRLRWVAVLGIALVLVGASTLFDDVLPARTAPWLWTTVVALLAYNLLLAQLGPRRGWPWLTRFPGQITIDCLALAIFVHLSGGIENPFLPLFVLHVVNANIVLSGRAALGVLGFAIALVTTIVLAEGRGLLPHHCLWASEAHSAGALDARALGVLVGLVLTLVASSLFTRYLTSRLRDGHRKLMASVDELAAEKHELATTRTAIETQRARLQAIIDCMGDAVIFLSPDGTPLFSNHRARAFWRPGEPPADIPSTVFERDGRAYDAIRSPVRSAQGEELGEVIVVRDVTDRLAMEKHLMHEERMSVVGKLAAAVAHEINNPIGVVSLYSQHALTKLSPSSPVFQHLETIRRSAESCRSIVGNLLKLARAPRPERRQVDLHQLCREVRESVQPLAARLGVQLPTDGLSSDIQIWAHADAGMLHQAMLNLAVNAIEAASEGDEVSFAARETHDGELIAQTIEVRDTGPGIAPRDLEQIFQPFFTTKATGTGLGLSIADNIVKSHGGRIEVESAAGRGTLFRIVLPAVVLDQLPTSSRVERGA